MRRSSIPRVRRWRARYFSGKTLLGEVVVDAPTKILARWAARDRARSINLTALMAADRETISPAPLDRAPAENNIH
jgi:hypothetical protein